MQRVLPVILLLAAGCAVASADSRTVQPARDFHAIDVAGTLAVDVTVGGALAVELRGDRHRIDSVTAEVKGGTLVLGTKPNTQHQKGKLEVLVTLPALTTLRISGTGALEVHALAGGRLDLDIPGTGSVKLDGKLATLNLDVAGTGSIDARPLDTRAVAIDVRGTAAIKLGGSPKVTKHITGVVAIN
jgi:hypothetical protein